MNKAWVGHNGYHWDVQTVASEVKKDGLSSPTFITLVLDLSPCLYLCPWCHAPSVPFQTPFQSATRPSSSHSLYWYFPALTHSHWQRRLAQSPCLASFSHPLCPLCRVPGQLLS